MKRRTTMIASATVLALSLPLAAIALTPGENFLTMWDYDGDGQVTLSEVLERRGDLFDSFDDNEDGVLSAAELAAHDEMRDEMQAQERLGWNDDTRPQGQGFGRGQGKGRMARAGGQGRMARQQGEMARNLGLDANGDNLVTQAEFMTAGEGWFGRFDRNGDGVVTQDDFGNRRW